MKYAVYNDNKDSFCISYDLSKNEVKDINRIIHIAQTIKAMDIIESNHDWITGGDIMVHINNGKVYCEKIK